MGNADNRENWNAFFREWGSRFLLFARQQADSFAEAEDILQDAFMHIWTRRELFPRIEPGLVFTHIRRMAVDGARRRKRRQNREQLYVVDKDPAYFSESPAFLPEELQAALEELPKEQREVLILKIWGEQTYEAIGDTLEISPNTAASRYRYGLEHLRKTLDGGAK